jgi:hypothetical protein
VIALPFGIGTNGHPIANGLTGGLLVAFVVSLPLLAVPARR